jgi:hypothetical protein
MLDAIKNLIRTKLQTKPLKNHTLIETAKLSPGKRSKIKSEATKPVTKGRKPKTKTKK